MMVSESLTSACARARGWSADHLTLVVVLGAQGHLNLFSPVPGHDAAKVSARR